MIDAAVLNSFHDDQADQSKKFRETSSAQPPKGDPKGSLAGV
jgi:hypothetical protein